MIFWPHKKIISVVVTLIFFIMGFLFFVNSASANTDPNIDLGPTILTDLHLSLPPASLISFPVIDPIPKDLTTEQFNNVLSNIETDGSVAGAASRTSAAIDALQNAQDACDAICSAAVAAGSSLVPKAAAVITAQKDLDITVASLSLALTNARNNQNPIIESLQVKNQAANVISDRTTAITGGVDTVSSDLAGNNQGDISAAAPVTGLTQAQQDAIAQAKANAAPWLTNDSLAITMQQTCSFGILPGTTMNFMPCIANAVYNVVYKPTAYALRGAGVIFDKMLSLSIDNSNNMVVPAFIDSSWTIVRDFSNMLFIFILLYTGIMTMFGAKDWRSTVLKVVIIALLINFSLFFTKIVIDAGNVLAVGIMSSISTTSISAGLAAAFQPQQFLTISAGTGDATGTNAIIVFFVAAVVSGFAAYIFFKAAILFVRRLVVFWFLMIMSPFAFISIALPKGNIFSKWLDTLTAQAFVAPMFLFFIYLIMKVISTGILSSFTQTGGWFEALLGPVIVAVVLIKALQMTLEFAEEMAGSTGEGFSKLVSGAIGLATGGATTLAAGALKMGAVAATGRLAKGAAEGSWQQKLATGTSKLSFDPRNLAGEKSILGKTIGKGISKAGGSLGVDVGKGNRNAEQVAKDRVDKDIKVAKEKEMSTVEQQRLRKDPAGATKTIEENLATEKAKLDAAQAEKDAAEKAENASDERKALDEAERAHKDASDRLERDRDTEQGAAAQKEFDEAKGKLKYATTAHTGASTTVALARTLAKLKDAEKDEAAAQKIAEETDAEKRATWAIEKQNKDRRNTYAEKIQKGNPVAAAKIRKGDKPGGETVEDMIKKQAKKEIKEAEEKEKEGKK